MSNKSGIILEEEKTDEINKLESNIYGYYGIYDNNKFSIKKVDEMNEEEDEDIDKRTLYTGLFCGSYSKPELINFCYNILYTNLHYSFLIIWINVLLKYYQHIFDGTLGFTEIKKPAGIIQQATD